MNKQRISKILLSAGCGASVMLSLVCLYYILNLSKIDSIQIRSLINSLGLWSERILQLGVILAMLADIINAKEA